MSKYIKLEDAIKAYNQAVKKLVEYEMEEFDLGDFTECQFDTTQIKLIARMIYSLPTIEVSEDCISKDYLEQEIENHLLSTENLRTEKDEWWNKAFEVMVEIIEDAPSVVPTCQKNRQVEREEGEWIIEEKDSIYGKKIRLTCPECGDVFDVTEAAFPHERYCRYCGSKMRG